MFNLKRMKIWVPLMILTLSSPAVGETTVFESGVKKKSLIELYSSEGCSSCPPAEKWLVNLRQNKGLWKDFVPVEFHVDYWNRLGWVDPFSNKSFTKRQHRYASEWNSSRVYTPGFVKDGKEWRRQGSLKANTAKGGGQLKVTSGDQKTFDVLYIPRSSKTANLKLVGSLLGNGLSTEVPRGENAGEVLRHEFVVLNLNEVRLKKQNDGTFKASIKLPRNYKAQPKSLSAAFWVRSATSQAPLQVVGGDL